MLITEEQKIRLLFAIDKAEGHGKCSYCLDDGTVACVTAQLAVMEQVPLKTIQRWTDSIYNIAPRCKELKEYPPELLQYLQFLWDDKSIPDSVARSLMRQLVCADSLESLNATAKELKLSTFNS